LDAVSSLGSATSCFQLNTFNDTPVTVADHIKPHRGDYALFRLGKLRSLCVECHNALDANNHSPVCSRSPVRADGWPTDPRHPWNRS
jgi:hypothetical protein